MSSLFSTTANAAVTIAAVCGGVVWAWRVLRHLAGIGRSVKGLPVVMADVAALKLTTDDHGKRITAVERHIIGATPAPVTINNVGATTA